MVGRKGNRTLQQRVGKNLYAHRERLGWTQAQLAERTGINPETISRYERGASLPSLTTLEQLAGALRAEIGDLVSESKPQPIDEAKLVSAWLGNLSSKDRAHAIAVLKLSCEYLQNRNG